MHDLADFLNPIDLLEINEDNPFNEGQLGKKVVVHEKSIPDFSNADIVLIGVNDMRGAGRFNENVNSANAVRKELYQLYQWHPSISIVDLGNIKSGALLKDTYAALKTVLVELLRLQKTIIILGGSHDLTLAQYDAYKELNQIIETTCIDSLIDLQADSVLKNENFLLEMLTSEPNMVKHYNHIGFQSYFIHPRLLETMDKLRFDCFRLGIVKEDIEEMEPVIRNTHLLSIDISSIKNTDAPANTYSPNGFTGEEICTLSQYAGQSTHISTVGIYGYDAQMDKNQLTAKQISQMIWYFIDGKNKGNQEPQLNDTASFNEYHTCFSETETLFLQSKRSGRWWMQLPDKKFIACSHKDYIKASNNQMPERWLRSLERLT
jgi:arginase family enzyme